MSLLGQPGIVARMKVEVLPDKFKGTLAADRVANAIAEGWTKGRPGDEVRAQPITDGGDGFGEILSGLLRADSQGVRTHDAAGRPIESSWWLEPTSQTAIVESARVIGLALLPERGYHPFDLDTSGLGPVLRAVESARPARCLIGIGGSATNDGGFGVARALGWRFLNCHGGDIDRWTDLVDLKAIERPETSLAIAEIRVAVDVQNPLLGATGASRIYGPQKGLGPDDLAKAEACLERLATVLDEQGILKQGAAIPGSGAAGGLGLGLMAFLGAELESGFSVFARWASLQATIVGSDLVITGEGKMDGSTLMGKGVGEVARWCQRAGVPCVGIGGAVDDLEALRGHFQAMYGLTPDFVTSERAYAEPEQALKALVASVAANWPGD